MSRARRIPPAREDLYTRHSLRVVQAFERGDVDFYGYGVISFFVDQLARPLGPEEIAYTLDGLAEALRWEQDVGMGTEQLRRVLHAVREGGWLDFDVRPGQRRPWVFRLGRAAIDEDPSIRPPPDLHSENPLPSGGHVHPVEVERATTSQDQAESDASDLLAGGGPREERSRNEKKEDPATNDDQAVGKTTAAETDAFLSAVESLNCGSSLDDLHRAIDRAREAARRRDDLDLDAVLPEPREGEEGVMRDLQALADARLGRWVEEVES